MAGPALLSWVTLTISPIDITNALTDTLARVGPVVDARQTAVSLRAQLDFASERSRIAEQMSGATVQTFATATVRRIDADAASYTPRLGDHITAITDRRGRTEAASLYVAESRKSAYWPNGASTMLIRLSDKHPERSATL